MIRHFSAASDLAEKYWLGLSEIKMGEARSLSHFVLEVRLEINSQTELNPARAGITVRRNQLGAHHTKVCGVGNAKSWIEKRWVIKRIEEVKRKLELRSFMDCGDFPEPQVEVLEPEAA